MLPFEKLMETMATTPQKMRTCTDICIQFQGITAPPRAGSNLADLPLSLLRLTRAPVWMGPRMSTFYKVRL